MEKDFVDGGVSRSDVPREIMEKFWDDLMGFADYAFNKSHSARCMGLSRIGLLYLKAHYPAAFMAAVMTSDYDDTDRLAIEITDVSTWALQYSHQASMKVSTSLP